MRMSASSLSNRNRRDRAGELGLSHAGGAEEDERADRPARIAQPARGSAGRRVAMARERLFLPDDALAELVLHLQELLRLLFLQPPRRGSRSCREMTFAISSFASRSDSLSCLESLHSRCRSWMRSAGSPSPGPGTPPPSRTPAPGWPLPSPWTPPRRSRSRSRSSVGHRRHREARPRPGLVDHVDRLVGKEPSR